MRVPGALQQYITPMIEPNFLVEYNPNVMLLNTAFPIGQCKDGTINHLPLTTREAETFIKLKSALKELLWSPDTEWPD